MHLAKGPRRTDLMLHTMTLQQKQYLSEVERELERTQARNHRLRQNIRSMSAKLQIANLQERLDLYERAAPSLRAVQ
jgi:septal ring factor EnvC (AmiA/AmiB activator)